LPTKENIAEEIISNAIAAAVEDYRFGPVQKEELSELSYTIYILNKPEMVKNIQDLAKFSEEKFRQAGLNPKKYGIIVKSGQKSGLLLPDLEGIDTVGQQVSIACQKAGIDQTREEITIYKFTVEKYA
jgi:AMMECR1 domain-containing protein